MYERNFYSAIEVFKVRMHDMGLTGRKVADKLGIDYGWLSRMLSGKSIITRAQYLILCDELDFSPNELREQFPGDFDIDGGLRAVGAPARYIHSRDRER